MNMLIIHSSLAAGCPNESSHHVTLVVVVVGGFVLLMMTVSLELVSYLAKW